MSYDNSGTLEPAATYSEVTRTFDTALNLNVSGADSLRLYYRGQAITFGELSGYIAMSGEGSDITGTADQFRYAYKTLTGNGSIVARVDSIQNVNAWSKAGIMIRDTLDANSVHVTAVLGANGTAEMQNRGTKGGSTAISDVTGLGAPCWVKITRNGNIFTIQRSKDGAKWSSFGTDPNTATTVTITMSNQVYIGLVVCSHVADVLATGTFSNVSTTGTISTGAWTVAPIGDATQADGLNTIDALYIVAEDSAGHKAKVYAPGHAVGTALWTELNIPYSQFTGVDMSKLKKLTIGVGDAAATAKGKGNIYIDNISYGHTIVK
jgi:regulation of enolase protein 1 (concanavalin A-like superfamily)